MENTTSANNQYLKKVWKDIDIKILGEYQDLYVLRNTLLLTDVFQSFRNKCVEISKLDSTYFLPVSGLS